MIPSRKRWEAIFKHLESTPVINDIVISGGDCYLLQPEEIDYIGRRLLDIPHIRRFRFASKGLAVCPSRVLDETDTWADAVIAVERRARQMGKQVFLHTHFNHANEITWVAKAAALKLFRAGVLMRNQTVLLKGVNDDVDVMKSLIRGLCHMNIQPVGPCALPSALSPTCHCELTDFRVFQQYYVYQHDMVRGVEHLRTPLQTILDLETQITGFTGGYNVPKFIVDLPGGGGKRPASTYLSYDRESGISTYVAPAVTAVAGEGKKQSIFEYYDPVERVLAGVNGRLMLLPTAGQEVVGEMSSET